ncbi:hypothetical protein [Nonomuraea roseoviolacea]|uniref:hypothetical protein n=1 Tax=Nonomuraea roseoviolacea TaxID=103837 RepID=UPI0031DFCB99
MNDLQSEIEAAQKTFGINPHRNFNLPGGLSRDYGTVEVRMTEHARGSDLPFYRGQAASLSITPNVWQTVAFTPMSDPYQLAAASGDLLTLNETGMWFIAARAEYKATGHTLKNSAKRMMRILVDGEDVGLRDWTGEKPENAFALHNHISWPENLAAGTTIRVQIRTDVTAPEHVMLANVTFRAYLIRCTDGVVAESKIRAIDNTGATI